MITPDGSYGFGPFSLDVAGRALMVHGIRAAIGGRAFDVLVALVRRHGALATKAALMNEVWSGMVVEENNLTTQVLGLRKLLAVHDPATTYIVTVAGRGYRFVAPVAERPAVTPVAPGSVATAEVADNHNLPLDMSSFVGRTVELADIVQRVQQRRLVTLVGAGGVGKTRCALKAARACLPFFADGIRLVELAPLGEPALVAEAVCRVLGATIDGGRTAIEVATGFLRQRALLLILDNCEHMLAAAAALADALLAHCPGVTILATSRQKLGLDGETLYPMPSLPVPDGMPAPAMSASVALQSAAVQLFLARAEDALGQYSLTDADAPYVAAICRRVDGVAMAIELAAARMRMLKPREIAGRLEDTFRLLTGGSRGALPRQQTLRATIDWSYVLLTPLEQAMLRRLAVFVDGFSLAGAEAVASGAGIEPDDALDLLTALMDRSLVKADLTCTVTRYRLQEMTRQFAREKLLASGDAGHERQLAAYLLQFYARAERAWNVTATETWLAEFACEIENLRAAIEWAFRPYGNGGNDQDAALGVGLVAVAGRVATELSLQPDIGRWTAAASVHLTETAPCGPAAWVLYWTAQHEPTFGVDEVSAVRRRMIALFRQAGDPVGLSCALRTTGISIARPDAEGGEALAMLSEAVALLRPLGASKDLATALAHLGTYHYINGQDDVATTLNEEALTMRRTLGDRTGVSISYLNLGEFAFVRGDVAGAIAYATDAVAASRRYNLLEILGTALSNLANYRLAMDDIGGGVDAALEAIDLLRAMAKPDHVVLCLEHVALAQALQGDLDAAARMAGYTDRYFTLTKQLREPSELLRYRRLLRLLDALPAATLESLMADGARWSDREAGSAALARRLDGAA